MAGDELGRYYANSTRRVKPESRRNSGALIRHGGRNIYNEQMKIAGSDPKKPGLLSIVAALLVPS
jgi:hypothetical protein